MTRKAAGYSFRATDKRSKPILPEVRPNKRYRRKRKQVS
jgi:hypothetical protein